MLSKSLQDGLTKYSIGDKLRALRLRKKIGLVDLGKHTGLSPALLSKLENGKLFPTLPTLMRIAMVYSVGLDHFFATEESGPVLSLVRRKDRQKLPDAPGAADVNYFFESLDFPAKDRRLSAYLADFRSVPVEQVRKHHHAGVELIYLVRGLLEVRFAKEDHTLSEGDAIYFVASMPHGYRRVGSKPCAGIVVTSS